ncbi:amino acid/polyamine/organocation transporter, APC superfamily [Agrococcus baldri]|uniref:Amino acid/polyamine/organocation transporter, APC superfamily n=1 Tax=Agrococcus baldri TaxID=153730 RepID=A0AA94HN89_9MICO|nr:APC family permease [Agrococcus baldri]SFS14899.1 amino acid/polyamine/organocation transporter, APC superfamily [Agrococcus baldri]
MDTEVQHGALKANQLGVPAVVFLVLAAVAPLTVAIVVLPLAIGFGNGGGIPVAVIVVALALLLFAIGYAQMSKELVNAGGFYAIAVRGLGRTAGLITGLIATLGYNFFVAGALGTIGFFTGAVVLPALFGFEVHWFIAGLVLFVIVFLLARSGIHMSAVVLGVALVLETLILVAFAISVLVQTGFSLEAFTLALSPEILIGGSIWIAFLMVATAFIGFEATALFSEEAREPRKTIPRATYTAIIAIGVIHAIVGWAIVSAVGVQDAQESALDHLAAGDMTLVLIDTYLGPVVGMVALVLLVVSLFAAQLAFHNSAARYLYALGRARVLPRWLSKTNRNGAPERAQLVNLVFAVAVAGIFAIFVETDPDGAPLPPVLTLVPVGLGFATLAIMIVQTIAALAVVVYFRKRSDPRLWSTLIAPGLGFLALLGFSIGALFNFTLVAGSEALYVRLMPWLLLLAVIGGVGYAAYLRSRKPEVYRGLDADIERLDELDEEPVRA